MNPVALLSRVSAWTAMALFCAGAVAGGIDAAAFDDAQQERRYSQLTQELRCLVCQNQSIAESNADLAKDMRAIIMRMMKDGASNDDIVNFMVARYGDFVRYQPPFTWQTAALWLSPFLLALAAAGAAAQLVAKQRRARLSDEERARARKILEE